MLASMFIKLKILFLSGKWVYMFVMNSHINISRIILKRKNGFFGNDIMNKYKTLVTSAFWEDELTDEVGVIAPIGDTYRSPQKLVVESKIVCS